MTKIKVLMIFDLIKKLIAVNPKLRALLATGFFLRRISNGRLSQSRYAEADEVIDAIAKTVAELTRQT